MSAADPQTILVAGDLVLDHHIYEGRRHHYGDGSSPGVNVHQQAGGAAIVDDLLDGLLNPAEWISQLAVKPPKTPEECLGIDRSQHAYAFWRPFPRDASPDKQFWRVSEAMGFGATPGRASCKLWPPAEKLPENLQVIVVSEGGMGFRQYPECWQTLPFDKARWIVLKTTSPIAHGDLWNTLVDKYSQKLVVIASAHDLRKSPARLNASVSWDDTAERLIAELQTDRAFAPLTRARHLIIAFSCEGAAWINFETGQVHLVYDAPSIEGDQAHEVPGTAFGFLSCLAAATACQITRNMDQPDFEAAAESGLAAMRDLRAKGHGTALDVPIGFPTKRLAKVIKSPEWRYSVARFPFSDKSRTTAAGARRKAEWSILQEAERGLSPAYGLARLVALRGPIAVRNVPHLEIGKLLTVDRHDIEALRNLSKVVRNYKDHDAGKKPLSIGVFGPPGAGKSFSVKELATKFVGSESWMEFNLSQFASTEDLVGAFHQVRDKALQGRIPIAFFDEFDSQSYRWLQYLLAPMQDGKFQEGQVTHPIGKCIFVFAGGTSWTFETFGPPEPDPAAPEPEAYTKFRLAKGPDFKSRLDAYLNVVGPNQRKLAELKDGKYSWVEDPGDIYFPIRRALMMRSELKLSPEQKLDMDEGVLHALLHVDEFKHGSRSLGKILQPFIVNPHEPLTRSMLPSATQLEMHTTGAKFVELCESAAPRAWDVESMSGEQPLGPNDPLSESNVGELAPAIHACYEELGKKAGWLKTPTEFDKLGDFLKSSNRAAARRMIRILDLVGLRLVDEKDTSVDQAEVRRYIEYHLELMAEAEHAGWMQWHLDQGWRYAKDTDKAKCLHKCLLPYEKLSFEDQLKDRDAVRHYPDFAHLAKRKIMFA